MSTVVATSIIISSATLAANGTTLTVNLSGNTGTMSPASPTGWFVYVNGIFNPVTVASMNTASGVNTLTLGEPVRSGQDVRLRYDFTSVGGTQITDSAAAPGLLIYVDGYAVTNNSTVTSNLTLTSPTLAANGTTLTFTVGGSTGTLVLASSMLGTGNGNVLYTPYGFRVISGTNAAVIPVVAASIASTTLTLTLQYPVPSGVTVNYLYDYRGGAQLWDGAGTINSLGNVTTQTAVTNNSTLTANFFTDTFNGTNGSNLSAHTPDVGTSWTAAATSFTISNGAQSGTSTTLFVHNATFPGVATNLMTAVGTPATNNYRVYFDIYLKTLANENITLYVRSNAGATVCYSVTFNPNSKTLTVNKVGGSFPSGSTNVYSLSATTFAAGQTYTLGFEVIDAFIHDSRGGSSVTSYTVTAAGSGYTTNPIATVNGGNGNGVSAVTTLTRSANTVGTIVPQIGINWGTGYWLVPTVAITGGSGSGATATAQLSQGMPTSIVNLYWATGSQQTLTTPVLTIVDNYSPIQTAGAILISAVNDGPSNGCWFANFKIDYGAHGTTPVQPQYNALLGFTDSAYPYSTVNVKMNSLPALDGVPPYSYSLYQNTALNRTGETLISALGATPSTLIYTDTPAYSTARRYYYYVVTDTISQVSQTFQKPAGGSAYPQFIAFQRDTPLNMYFIGDSETSSGLFAPVVFGILSRYKAPRTVNGVLEGTSSPIAYATYIQGISGSNTGGWVQGQSNYNTAKAAIISLKCTVVTIMLGANDVRDGQTYNSWITPAQYGSNLSNIASNMIADVVSGGGVLAKVILQFPYTAANGSYANGNVWMTDSVSRISEYQAQINALDNGTSIFAADNHLDQMFGQNTQFYADGVHPSSNAVYGSFNGQMWMGFGWADAIGRALYPATINQVSGSVAPVRSGLSG